MPKGWIDKVLGGDHQAWDQAKDSCPKADWKCVGGVAKRIAANRADAKESRPFTFADLNDALASMPEGVKKEVAHLLPEWSDFEMGGAPDMIGRPYGAPTRAGEPPTFDPVAADEDKEDQDLLGIRPYYPREEHMKKSLTDRLVEGLLAEDHVPGHPDGCDCAQCVECMPEAQQTEMTTTGDIATVPMGFKVKPEDIPDDEETAKTGISVTPKPTEALVDSLLGEAVSYDYPAALSAFQKKIVADLDHAKHEIENAAHWAAKMDVEHMGELDHKRLLDLRVQMTKDAYTLKGYADALSAAVLRFTRS